MCGQGSGLLRSTGQRQLNDFRLLEIEAKPAQSQQESQSYREADGYIPFVPRFSANEILRTRQAEQMTPIAKPAARPRRDHSSETFDI
jgi:hypothetical protein